MFTHDYAHTSPPRKTGRPISLEGQIALPQTTEQKTGRLQRGRLLFDAVIHQIGAWMKDRRGNLSSSGRNKPYSPVQ